MSLKVKRLMSRMSQGKKMTERHYQCNASLEIVECAVMAVWRGLTDLEEMRLVIEVSSE